MAVMSRPAKPVRPAWGLSSAVSCAISVVLPAPFGPMTACSSPSGTARLTLSDAVMPPKRLLKPSIASNGSGMPPPQHAIDTAARVDDDEYQKRADDELRVFGDSRERLLEHQQRHGADERTEWRAHAAEHYYHDKIARARPVHHRGADEVGVVGEQHAGKPEIGR